jgi:hypothetical protein
MDIFFKLIDSEKNIKDKILISIKEYLDPIFKNIAISLQPKLYQLLIQAFNTEPEYNSLISGKLKYELGVPDASERLNRIYDFWAKSAIIKSSPISVKRSSLSGGFSLSMIKSDFSDILGLSETSITDDISGSIIPWFRWLLLDGDKILVRDYRVRMGPNERSRTGLAIMVSSEKNNWRVPSEFAGTINNNWITRSIEKIDSSILNMLENELEKNL